MEQKHYWKKTDEKDLRIIMNCKNDNYQEKHTYAYLSKTVKNENQR